jgi:hypothetical protein
MTKAFSGNPTNAVGGSFILNLPETTRGARIPPTQLVDPSYPAFWQGSDCGCKLGMNNPPTALVEFGTSPRRPRVG